MSRDPVTDARDLVRDLFPQARWAVLTGSVLTPRRTAGSDLDIVVLLPDGDADAPHRNSLHWRGWPVEMFVHDRETLELYLARDLTGRRPTLYRMIATGQLIVADDPHGAAVQGQCREVLAAGPAPLTDADRAVLRYGLTDLLDDFTHAADEDERAVTTAIMWLRSAEHALAYGGHWQGTGKWLLRELTDMDPKLARRWLDIRNDPDAVASFTRDVLDSGGGPLFAGHRLRGERP